MRGKTEHWSTFIQLLIFLTQIFEVCKRSCIRKKIASGRGTFIWDSRIGHKSNSKIGIIKVFMNRTQDIFQKKYIYIYKNIIYIYIYKNTYLMLVRLDKGGQPHCVKSVRIWSYSGPHFPPFGLNIERYRVSLRIQSEWGETRTKITPNTDTFHAVLLFWQVNFHSGFHIKIYKFQSYVWYLNKFRFVALNVILNNQRNIPAKRCLRLGS